MKKWRFVSIFAAFAFALSFAGCKNDAEIEQITQINTESQQVTVVADAEYVEQTNVENQQVAASSDIEYSEQISTESQEITTFTEPTDKIIETTISIVTDEDTSDIMISREYEFDLEKYIEFLGRRDKTNWDMRDRLDFLSDEQYDTFLRSWILIDKMEYRIVPNTSEISTHYLTESGRVRTGYYRTPKLCVEDFNPYIYVSTYQSFYEYLQSVFSQESVDKIMTDKRFMVACDELYFAWCGRNTDEYWDDWEVPKYLQKVGFRLVENNDYEILFEHIAYYKDKETEWTEIHPIKLINTDNGWRSEMFDFLQVESKK